MIRSAPRPVRLVLLAVLAVGATLLSAQAAWACEAWDDYNNPRPCTFLEEYGECLVSAYDAHYQCLDRADGFTDALTCHVGTQVDLLVCNVGMPIELIKRLLNPF